MTRVGATAIPSRPLRGGEAGEVHLAEHEQQLLCPAKLATADRGAELVGRHCSELGLRIALSEEGAEQQGAVEQAMEVAHQREAVAGVVVRRPAEPALEGERVD